MLTISKEFNNNIYVQNTKKIEAKMLNIYFKSLL